MSEMKVTLDERIRRIGALEQESHHHQLVCDRNMQVVQQKSVDELHLEKQHSQAKVFELETQLQQATLQVHGRTLADGMGALSIQVLYHKNEGLRLSSVLFPHDERLRFNSG